MENIAATEIDRRIAEMDKVYWAIVHGELYVRRGTSKLANRFYTHTDPSGTVYWAFDSNAVKKAEFESIQEWNDGAVPTANDIEDQP